MRNRIALTLIVAAGAIVGVDALLGGPPAPLDFVQAAAAQEPQPETEPAPVEPAEELAPVEPESVEEPEPELEPVEEQAVEPEPEPEPVTLSDVYGSLQAAITAEAANQVTVGAATDALEEARQALVAAEGAHAAAMEDQGEHDASIRAAAQAFVDFLTEAYLR